jgi:hypothetical protein
MLFSFAFGGSALVASAPVSLALLLLASLRLVLVGELCWLCGRAEMPRLVGEATGEGDGEKPTPTVSMTVSLDALSDLSLL